MSYDIRLTDPVSGDTLLLDQAHELCGGTYAIGGTREAWLNVTYNYADWYHKPGVFPDGDEDYEGIRAIYGLTGAESIPVLEHAIDALNAMEEPMTQEEIEKTARERGGHYWVETKANALRPLHQLLALARLRPDGIWEGD